MACGSSEIFSAILNIYLMVHCETLLLVSPHIQLFVNDGSNIHDHDYPLLHLLCYKIWQLQNLNCILKTTAEPMLAEMCSGKACEQIKFVSNNG